LAMSEFFVYIARCSDGSLYTGYTSDLEMREKQHNEGKGARYTRGRGPVKIVYSERFQNKSNAMKREYQIKKMKREEKERLV